MAGCGHNYREIDNFLKGLDSRKGALIEVLHYVQDLYGYIDEPMQEYISKRMKIPRSKIYGVISFYSYFTTEPKGEHVISVCTGTACFVKGSHEILEEFKKILKINPGETTKDGKFTLNTLRCVGACGLAPVVSVGDKLYGKFKKEDVRKVIMEYCEDKHGTN